jgi:hypothetical protein
MSDTPKQHAATAVPDDWPCAGCPIQHMTRTQAVLHFAQYRTPWQQQPPVMCWIGTEGVAAGRSVVDRGELPADRAEEHACLVWADHGDARAEAGELLRDSLDALATQSYGHACGHRVSVT